MNCATLPGIPSVSFARKKEGKEERKRYTLDDRVGNIGVGKFNGKVGVI